jgi:hypothetical protein
MNDSQNNKIIGAEPNLCIQCLFDMDNIVTSRGSSLDFVSRKYQCKQSSSKLYVVFNIHTDWYHLSLIPMELIATA